MTLQQLRYVTTVAETGTISGAAKALFISQPSLTAAIQELEKEMGITIFLRTNRGVVLSREGDEFLGYARQVLMQAELLEDRYGAQSSHRQQFAVSAQHYNFAARVFARVVRDMGGERYSMTFRETTTYEVIETVPVIVIKKDKSREVFDRNKLINGLLRACANRPISIAAIEKMVDDIEAKLQNSLDREVSSTLIGEYAMEALKEVDEVAYVRFASVYRQFKDINSFLEELNQLMKNKN